MKKIVVATLAVILIVCVTPMAISEGGQVRFDVMNGQKVFFGTLDDVLDYLENLTRQDLIDLAEVDRGEGAFYARVLATDEIMKWADGNNISAYDMTKNQLEYRLLQNGLLLIADEEGNVTANQMVGRDDIGHIDDRNFSKVYDKKRRGIIERYTQPESYPTAQWPYDYLSEDEGFEDHEIFRALVLARHWSMKHDKWAYFMAWLVVPEEVTGGRTAYARPTVKPTRRPTSEPTKRPPRPTSTPENHPRPTERPTSRPTTEPTPENHPRPTERPPEGEGEESQDPDPFDDGGSGDGGSGQPSSDPDPFDDGGSGDGGSGQPSSDPDPFDDGGSGDGGSGQPSSDPDPFDSGSGDGGSGSAGGSGSESKDPDPFSGGGSGDEGTGGSGDGGSGSAGGSGSESKDPDPFSGGGSGGSDSGSGRPSESGGGSDPENGSRPSDDGGGASHCEDRGGFGSSSSDEDPF